MTPVNIGGPGSLGRPNPLVVIAVNAYLLAVGMWLIATRQIPAPGFLRIGLALMKRPYSGDVKSCVAESGQCFLATLPEGLLSDRDSASALRLFEDGRELGPAHASHSDIRQHGGGRYSHWGDQLYFSASDNSDPRTNGRRYSVREVR
jgi:hypothetical protein